MTTAGHATLIHHQTAYEAQCWIGFHHAPVGLLVTTGEVVQAANARACAITGYGREKLLGQRFALLHDDPTTFEAFHARAAQRMDRLGHHEEDRLLRHRSGRLFRCQLRGQRASPESDDDRTVWSLASMDDSRQTTELNDRELAIAHLLSEGRTSKEIARIMNLSPRTIEAQRALLLQKLDARNSAELVARFALLLN